MNKKILIGSILAVAILTLVSFSSVVGYSSVKNTQEEIITIDYDFEYCKDYLFETLVEISNNEDVNDLINNNNQNLLPTNTNNRLLMPFRRSTNRMSLSVEKLDLLYNMGKKLIDRLGEDKVVEIMETISIDKPDFTDELFTTIMGIDELKERIYTLNEMNVEDMSMPLDWEDTPIICAISAVLAVITFIMIMPLDAILSLLLETGLNILATIFFLFYSPVAITFVVAFGFFLGF